MIPTPIPTPIQSPIVVSFGGGTNSTALLIGMHERGQRPDLILFADTGNEKPHTYDHLVTVSDWCVSIGFPAIVTVRKGGTAETLEEVCLRLKCLPSVAYGFKTCSQRFKTEPQETYLNNWVGAQFAWSLGLQVTKLIGFDADEPQRAKNYTGDKFIVSYPLIEWGWGRDECIEAITRSGLPQPGKSSCFFCPNSKEHEIIELDRTYPLLMARALHMEANADLDTIKGLGRRWAWADLIRSDRAQTTMFSQPSEMPCDCYDG